MVTIVHLRELYGAISELEYSKKQNLLGKVLTITDSIANSPEQRKSLKDLVQEAFYGNQVIGGYDALTNEFDLLCEATGLGESLWEKPEQQPAIEKPDNKYKKIK